MRPGRRCYPTSPLPLACTACQSPRGKLTSLAHLGGACHAGGVDPGLRVVGGHGRVVPPARCAVGGWHPPMGHGEQCWRLQQAARGSKAGRWGSTPSEPQAGGQAGRQAGGRAGAHGYCVSILLQRGALLSRMLRQRPAPLQSFSVSCLVCRQAMVATAAAGAVIRAGMRAEVAMLSGGACTPRQQQEQQQSWQCIRREQRCQAVAHALLCPVMQAALLPTTLLRTPDPAPRLLPLNW